MTSLVMAGGNFSLKSIAQFFVNLNEKRIQRKQINNTIKQLSALTDRELTDMGISRCDIWQVAHGHDPRNFNDNLKGWV